MDVLEKFDSAKAIIDRHPTETDQTRQEKAHADLRVAAQAVIDSVRWRGQPLDQNNKTLGNVPEDPTATVNVKAVIKLRGLLNG